MKINYDNTALGLLEKMDPFAFRICEDGDHSPIEYKRAFGLSVVQNWHLIVDRFKEKIQYISDPFYKAYLMSCHKLTSVIDAEDIHESGTLISRATPSETNTIFYDISSEGRGQDFKLTAVIFFFTKETKMDKPSLAVYVQRNSKGFKSYISETGTKNDVTPMSVIGDIFSMILFMKYCELQTKMVQPKTKEKLIGCKYLNETNQKVEILDSTWFTTIVRSEGFSVRGHFRMQPYKETKKLIWISDFEKTGYTKRSKIERENA